MATAVLSLKLKMMSKVYLVKIGKIQIGYGLDGFAKLLPQPPFLVSRKNRIVELVGTCRLWELNGLFLFFFFMELEKFSGVFPS